MFRSASLFIGTSFTAAVFTIFATSYVDSIVGIPYKKYSMQKKNDLFVKCAHLHPGHAENLVARSRYYHCHWTVLILNSLMRTTYCNTPIKYTLLLVIAKDFESKESKMPRFDLGWIPTVQSTDCQQRSSEIKPEQNTCRSPWWTSMKMLSFLDHCRQF